MKYVIDIDGTIFNSRLTAEGKYELESVNIPMVQKINALHEDGHEVILWTGRHWNHLDVTISQLWMSNVRYTTLVMGKPVADVYVDDLAMRPEEFLNGAV